MSARWLAPSAPQGRGRSAERVTVGVGTWAERDRRFVTRKSGPRFVSVPQAAALLHLSEETVRRRIADGRIAAVRCGRLHRVRLDLLGARGGDQR